MMTTTLSAMRASVGVASAASMYAAAASTAGKAVAAKTPDSGSATRVTLSNRALDLMQKRQVSADEQDRFKDILARATAANAADAPKSFLGTLSAADMEILRKVHSLAEPIDIPSLSNEGAANLLVQPGSAEDLDNNGLTSIGAGNTFTFPPRNAPESFKAAWEATTAGMSFADIPTQMIFAVGLANIRVDDRTGAVRTLSPDDPEWRNPYADPAYDYRGAVNNIMGGLEDGFKRGLLTREIYTKDMAFYGRLAKALG